MKTTKSKSKSKKTKVKAKESPAKVVDKEEAKLGEAIIKASMEGHALSRTYEQQTVEVLGDMLGKNFVMTPTGAHIKKGVKLTKLEAAKAISTLAEITERNDTVRATTTLALGNIIIEVKEQFGEDEGNKIIEQVASTVGRSKHTIGESERVARWTHKVFKDEVPEGLSTTHLMEMKNYSQDKAGNVTIEAADVRKIAKKVQEGKVVSPKLKTANGKAVEQRKILNCAETRALLKEARGDKGKNNAPKSGKFFYVDTKTGEVFKSSGLDKDACKSGDYIVIDAKGDNVMGAKGGVYASIGELKVAKEEEEQAPTAPPVKKEPAPKATKKKAEKKDKEEDLSQIPD